ncbi:MAG: EamA family transporter [Candidatus Woykebacteria bacterium]
MKISFLIWTLVIIFFWGLWGLFSKIAANKLGLQSALWGAFITFPIIMVGYLLVSKQIYPLNLDKAGIFYSLAGGVVGAIGTIIFIPLLKQEQASILIPITALYPAVTVVLAILFLHEKLTLPQIGGIILALGSIFLVSLSGKS